MKAAHQLVALFLLAAFCIGAFFDPGFVSSNVLMKPEEFSWYHLGQHAFAMLVLAIPLIALFSVIVFINRLLGFKSRLVSFLNFCGGMAIAVGIGTEVGMLARLGAMNIAGFLNLTIGLALLFSAYLSTLMYRNA